MENCILYVDTNAGEGNIMLCEKGKVNDQLLRLQNGDEKAFEELYRYTEKLLYSYILSLTGNTYTTEDIKQDTYIGNIKKY